MHYFKPADSTSGAPPAAALVWPLFILVVALWLAFGALSLWRAGSSIGMWIVAGLMFVNAGLLLLAGWGVRRRRRSAYFLALMILAVNIILTFTDQFGLFDFIYLAVAGGLVALLIMLREYYA